MASKKAAGHESAATDLEARELPSRVVSSQATSVKVSKQRPGGARHRRKGDRIEREIVERHRALGIHAERYPLSGASRFRGSGHDIDLYLFGRDDAPVVGEVKGRKSGAGFTTLERWLGECDALFLRRNNVDPLVVLPWRIWARILEQVRQ